MKAIKKQFKNKTEEYQNKFADDKYLKIPINCLEKKGFVDLFEALYNLFENQKISEENLNLLEKGTNYAKNPINLKALLEQHKEHILF